MERGFTSFQFLVLYGMTCCSDYPEDAMLESAFSSTTSGALVASIF